MKQEHDWSVPSVKDELERKAVENLEWIFGRLASKQMTMNQARIACQSAFNCVSGLVPNEVIGMFTDLKDDPAEVDEVRRVIHIPRVGTFVVSWRIGSEKVGITVIKPDSTATHKVETHPDAQTAFATQVRICVGLLNAPGAFEV